MAEIAFDGVRKVYPDGTVAVVDMSLEIPDGEFMVFVGPSGCGKTTALRMVAGLEEISGGEIRIGERVVNRMPPRERDIAMVFQNYALYPHKTVFDNLAFPLRLRRLPKAEVDRRVGQIARLLELEEHLGRKPRQLSGGQRQRVAMGRAIVRQPQAFLMDEPLSNLDAKLRTQMRAEISLLHKELGVTTIYVTHDQVEAMTLGHRVAVMRKGELQQVALAQAIYDHPANLFVAGFIGSPSMNFVQGEIERSDRALSVVFGKERIALDEKERASHSQLEGHVGKRVVVGVRPEHLADAALVSGGRADRRLRGLVRLKEALGSEIIVHFQIEAAPAVSPELTELEEVRESALLEQLDQRHVRRTAFVGRFGVDTQVVEDASAEIAVAPGALRFFSPETGQALTGAGGPEAP
ncbi:MAG: sn-glycerol-3-phosphate ABC transporter ATP-binding protein UgpC [Actinobacteria bacterium]|nr:MAG: sn-glycerol-3-phosphate ABC transporter ATP-binding protein UgpC [Actinomycetota bacterium]